jgi:hypothetical protein
LRSQKIFAIPTCSPKIVEDLEAVLEQFREIAGGVSFEESES